MRHFDLMIEVWLMDVNALIIPLGVRVQLANDSVPELRQIPFIACDLKVLFGMRIVERPYPIRHFRKPRFLQ